MTESTPESASILLMNQLASWFTSDSKSDSALVHHAFSTPRLQFPSFNRSEKYDSRYSEQQTFVPAHNFVVSCDIEFTIERNVRNDCRIGGRGKPTSKILNRAPNREADGVLRVIR